MGKEILNINNLTLKDDTRTYLKDFSMRVNKDDKIGFIGDEISITKFFQAICEEEENYEDQIKWGQTITKEYFPKDNSKFFDDIDLNLIDWLRQFSEEQSEIFIRGF